MFEGQQKSLEEIDNNESYEDNPDYVNRDDYVCSHTGDEVEDIKNS